MPVPGSQGFLFLVAREAGGWSGEGPAWYGETRSGAAPLEGVVEVACGSNRGRAPTERAGGEKSPLGGRNQASDGFAAATGLRDA